MRWNIEELSQAQAMDAAASELVVEFARELAKSVRKFRDASRLDDVAEAARLCDRMRGSADVYGFRRLAERLRSIEIMLRAGSALPSDVAAELMLVSKRIDRDVALLLPAVFEPPVSSTPDSPATRDGSVPPGSTSLP